MSDDRTPHTHRCPCGARWVCSKPDCALEDECPTCANTALELWADAQGYTMYQLSLPLKVS